LYPGIGATNRPAAAREGVFGSLTEATLALIVGSPARSDDDGAA
jgi:hypothetical protein